MGKALQDRFDDPEGYYNFQVQPLCCAKPCMPVRGLCLLGSYGGVVIGLSRVLGTQPCRTNLTTLRATTTSR